MNPRKQCLQLQQDWFINELTETASTYRICNSSISAQRLGIGHGILALTEKIFASGKEKICFLQQNTTGNMSHIPGQDLYPGVFGQHKTNPMVFCGLFASFCSVVGTFTNLIHLFSCLFWFLILRSVFFVGSGQRERT